MSAEDLIEQVRSLGGRILVDGDRMKIQASKGAITPELRDALASNKQEIINPNGTCTYEEEERLAIVNEDIRITRDLALSERERKILRALVRRFSGTIEWRKVQ